MRPNNGNNETRTLTVSALIATVFAGGGLAVGIVMGSLVIAFDGVYSLVSLLLTLLSLAAANQLKNSNSVLSLVGRNRVEAIVIAIKASVILFIVSVSLYSAVSSLFSGGRPIDTSIATIFGVLNVVGCGYAWWYIEKKNKALSSNLIDAESKQWQMDTMLSVAVTAGFIVAWFVEQTPWSGYSVYADPMMMILMSAYFIKVPAVMLKEAFTDLTKEKAKRKHAQQKQSSTARSRKRIATSNA
ncbi:cation transporter [Vibrio sp. E150_011]